MRPSKPDDRRAVLCAAAIAVLCATAVSAEQSPDWSRLMAEAPWDWRAGDLIFRSGIDPLDDRIAAATGAEFGSVAILRASSGGPRVVYVDPDEGVTEMLLAEFTAGLTEAEFAVYRAPAADVWGQADNPISYNALLVAYGRPADPYRLAGGAAYYSAELAMLAALGAGVALGAPTRLATLAGDDAALRDAFLAHWQDHPYCRYVVTRAECWATIGDLAVVTTASVLHDTDLIKMYP